MDKGLNQIIDDAIKLVQSYQANPTIKIYQSDLNITEFTSINDSNDEISSPVEKNYPKPAGEKGKAGMISDAANTESIKVDNQEWKNCKDLDSFARAISACPKCAVLVKHRTQVVFGTGNPDADIMIIGEAPGADEDKQGKPFVGRAGQLLTKILEAINLKREEVYIANILKCRPPQNRNPEPDEIVNCEPYLYRQLRMIKPKLILTLGTFASQTLLRTKEPLGKLRGRFHDYNGIKTMVTYHPAALLRNPNWKKYTWEDVKLLRNEYDKLLEA